MDPSLDFFLLFLLSCSFASPRILDRQCQYPPLPDPIAASQTGDHDHESGSWKAKKSELFSRLLTFLVNCALQLTASTVRVIQRLFLAQRNGAACAVTRSPQIFYQIVFLDRLEFLVCKNYPIEMHYPRAIGQCRDARIHD